jgi:hypothetical protein
MVIITAIQGLLKKSEEKFELDFESNFGQNFEQKCRKSKYLTKCENFN